MKIFFNLDGVALKKQDGVSLVNNPKDADLIICSSEKWADIQEDNSETPVIVADHIGNSVSLKGIGIVPLSDKSVDVDTLFVSGFVYNEDKDSVTFTIGSRSFTITNYTLNDNGSIDVNITTTDKDKTNKISYRLAIGSFSIAYKGKKNSQVNEHQEFTQPNKSGELTLESLGDLGDALFCDVSVDELNGTSKVPDSYDPKKLDEQMSRASAHPQAPLPRGVSPAFDPNMSLGEIQTEDDMMNLMAHLG